MNINELIHDFEESGYDWADKNAASDALEEARRALLSKLINHRMGLGDTKAKAEEMARGNSQYWKATDNWLQAKKEATKAKVAYELARIKVELYRTEAATRRAELENLHGTGP